MSNINREIQKLANINEDACEFYQEARDKAENPQLQTTFRNLESLHKTVVINLQEHLRSNGADVDTDETLEGEVREFWGKLMSSISNDVDETLVKHLEEAEDRCLHKIQDIMNDEDISESQKAILTKEQMALRKSHDYMKALKDMMKAA